MSRSRKSRRRKTLSTLSLSFGKYSGKPICSVPRDYLRWVLRAKDMPVTDVWIVREFLQLEQSQAHIRNDCRNSVRGAIHESATDAGQRANQGRQQPTPA